MKRKLHALSAFLLLAAFYIVPTRAYSQSAEVYVVDDWWVDWNDCEHAGENVYIDEVGWVWVPDDDCHPWWVHYAELYVHAWDLDSGTQYDIAVDNYYSGTHHNDVSWESDWEGESGVYNLTYDDYPYNINLNVIGAIAIASGDFQVSGKSVNPTTAGRTKFGIGEKTVLQLPSGVSGAWSVLTTNGGSLSASSGNAVTFTAPMHAVNPTVIRASNNGTNKDFNLEIILPSGIDSQTYVGNVSGYDLTKTQNASGPNTGAGTYFFTYFAPQTVNFWNAVLCENIASQNVTWPDASVTGLGATSDGTRMIPVNMTDNRYLDLAETGFFARSKNPGTSTFSYTRTITVRYQHDVGPTWTTASFTNSLFHRKEFNGDTATSDPGKARNVVGAGSTDQASGVLSGPWN